MDDRSCQDDPLPAGVVDRLTEDREEDGGDCLADSEADPGDGGDFLWKWEGLDLDGWVGLWRTFVGRAESWRVGDC